MGNIFSFFALIILLIYAYAKSTKLKKLQSTINKTDSQPTPKYIPSPPICPDQTGDHAAKCWYHSQKDSWSCRYIDKNGLIQDAHPKCCSNPSCEEVERKAKKYLHSHKKQKPITGKQYYCFNKYKESCYAKQKDLNKSSNNFCRINTASNISSPMYNTYDECYQQNLFYKDLSKKECLSNTYFGWCTDSKGNGQCLPGTGDGPNWSSKYNCQASMTGPKNSWTSGHTNPYIHVPSGHWKA